MKLTEMFLAELEREAVGTRKALEQVPDGRFDWAPHPKSMSLRRLPRWWRACRRGST